MSGKLTEFRDITDKPSPKLYALRAFTEISCQADVSFKLHPNYESITGRTNSLVTAGLQYYIPEPRNPLHCLSSLVF